jgi:SOS-response transcriptional repressor LexA
MGRLNLTQKQEAILDYIASVFKSELIQPTYREIAKEFGLASTNAIYDHLIALQKKGWIVMSSDRSRSLKFTSKARLKYGLFWKERNGLVETNSEQPERKEDEKLKASV